MATINTATCIKFVVKLINGLIVSGEITYPRRPTFCAGHIDWM